ncbi:MULTISPECIES: 16S rRNA (guanine(527)-N(7))-methyltransferase RsmG [unclassified Sphingomonas]|uniref:16S rRNA (guanine(527)-N(7))-methyltransferase RsmG n=1 Tax=Sphingomonas TaxID=13687 RepID=UPI00096401CA|nr:MULTISPECIES: RsmG family class I SAM-dependent methyltransferase [unclassified Sphingomonas]MBN8810131.1 16S rRNA (guanine(527)-N(7))-methyltransferase RsmG [Sphingomonas sp.]OJY50710.1 MAG: 16S rRNA (guanine(527)-N(7))-methyltransferase RsmG [Sphingomonas sp. 67-41]
MTENEARDWILNRFGVPRGTLLERFGGILREESTRQNLISAASFETLWARHFVDSAQLIPLAAEAEAGVWLDIGTGAGMPGLIVALLIDRPVVMVEPRIRRVEFLRDAIQALGIADRANVAHCKVEAYVPERKAAIVSARAVAALPDLFRTAAHCTDSSTIWLLPKGRSAQSEVEAARAKWQGAFHVEPSITQPESGIVVARKVRPR